MMTFRVVQQPNGRQVVEVMHDGKVCGVLYPDADGIGFTLISAHVERVERGTGAGPMPQLPFVHVTFNPRVYRVDPRTGAIIRE